MNTQVRNFLDALPVAAIVSNVKNNRIVYLNKAAKSYFKISEIDDKLTCQELLKLEGEDLKWYENVNLTSNIERFQVIYQNKTFHTRCCWTAVFWSMMAIRPDLM